MIDENSSPYDVIKSGSPRRKSSNSKLKYRSPGRKSDVFNILDNMSEATAKLRRSSGKKQKSEKKIETSFSKENVQNSPFGLGSLLGAAESSPLVELGDMQYRPSLGKTPTDSSRNRRQTFEGGSMAMEQLLQTSTDSDIIERNDGNNRRMTADPADIAAMMAELEEADSVADTSSSSAAEGVNVSGMSVSIGEAESSFQRSAAPSPASVSASTNDTPGDLSAMVRSSSRGRSGGSGRQSRSSRRSSGASNLSADPNFRLLNDSDDFDLGMNKSVESQDSQRKVNRRMTADPADIAAMMAELDEADSTAEGVNVSEMSMSMEAGDESVSSPVRKTPVAAASPAARRSPRFQRSAAPSPASVSASTNDTPSDLSAMVRSGSRGRSGGSGRQSRSSRRSSGASDVSPFNRRETFEGGTMAMEQMLRDTSDSDFSRDRGARSPADNRRMTADPADIAAMMAELEREESGANTSKSFDSSYDMSSPAPSVVDSEAAPGSRDSVDTMVLMDSVAALLDAHDESSQPLEVLMTSSQPADSKYEEESGMEEAQRDEVRGEEEKTTSTDDAHNISMDGDVTEDDTVNTAELFQSVDKLIQRTVGDDAEDNNVDDEGTISTTLSNLSAGDVSVGDSSYGEGNDTVSTLGSLRSLLAPSPSLASSPSATQKSSKRGSASPSSDSLHRLPQSPAAVLNSSAYTSPQNKPTSNYSFTAPTGGLKSCLSSRKKPRQSIGFSAKKNVVFGSPKAAEFNKHSPTTNFTPMHEKAAKERFSMAGAEPAVEEHDEQTDENSRILDEWDRLTNASEDDQSDEDESESGVASRKKRSRQSLDGKRRATISGYGPAAGTPSPKKKSRRKSIAAPMAQNSAALRRSKKEQRRRRSMVHGLICDDLKETTDDTGDDIVTGNDMSDMSVMSKSSSNHDLNESSISHTQNLPGNLGELLMDSDIANAMHSPDAASVVSDLSCDTPGPLNILVHSAAMNESIDRSMEEEEQTATMTLESNLSALMRNIADTSGMAPSPLSDESSSNSRGKSHSSSDLSERSSAAGLKDLLHDSECSSLDRSGPFSAPTRDQRGDPSPARMGDIAASSSPHSSPHLNASGDTCSGLSSVGSEESVVSFKKKTDKSRVSAAGDVSDFSMDFTEELEANISTLMKRMTEQSEEIRAEYSGSEEEGDASTSLVRSSIHSSGGLGSSIGSRKRLYIMDESGEEVNDSFSTLPEDGTGGAEVHDHSSLLDISTSMRQSYSAAGNGTQSGGTPLVLQRIRSMNAVSRQQQLSHCKTPLARDSRMSIGMKRHSISSRPVESTSALKKSTQKNKESLLNKMGLSRSALKAVKAKEEIDSNALIAVSESDSPIIVDLKASGQEIAEEDLEVFLSRLNLTAGSTATEAMITSRDSLHSVVQSFVENYVAQQEGGEETGFDVLSEQSEAEFSEAVSKVLGEVMGAAVDETAQSTDDATAELLSLWRTGIEGDSLPRSVRMLLVSGEEEGDSTALRTQTDTCIHNAFLRWRAWERDLVDVATQSFTEKKLALREDNSDLIAFLRQRTPRAEKQSRESLELQAMEEELEKAREALAASQAVVNQKKADLVQAKQAVSAVRAEKKDKLVSLANKMSDKAPVEVADVAVSEQSCDIEEKQRAVEDLRDRVDVINKITWCRLQCYKSSEIAVKVFLTPTETLDVSFSLHSSGDAIRVHSAQVTPSFPVDASSVSFHCVPHTPGAAKMNHTQQHRSAKEASGFSALLSEESKLAAVFFCEFLSSFARKGPLSEHALALITKPAEIPALLREISGYVGSLRSMLSWLNRSNLSPASSRDTTGVTRTEWSWTVTPASKSADMGSGVAIVHSSGARVDIPLAALVSGDMSLLPVDYYATQGESSEDAMEAQEALASVQHSLSGIADRCSSPFGSFPVGQILHAIAPK